MIQVQVNNSPKIQCKIFTLNIFKNVVLMVDNMKGVTEKVDILCRCQSDPALQKTLKRLFLQSPPYWCKLPNGSAGANFSNAVFKKVGSL